LKNKFTESEIQEIINEFETLKLWENGIMF
jgi:hypothetical protein